MISWPVVRLVGAGQRHDHAAKFVGAAHYIVYAWPPLPELESAGYNHRGFALES